MDASASDSDSNLFDGIHAEQKNNNNNNINCCEYVCGRGRASAGQYTLIVSWVGHYYLLFDWSHLFSACIQCESVMNKSGTQEESNKSAPKWNLQPKRCLLIDQIRIDRLISSCIDRLIHSFFLPGTSYLQCVMQICLNKLIALASIEREKWLKLRWAREEDLKWARKKRPTKENRKRKYVKRNRVIFDECDYIFCIRFFDDFLPSHCNGRDFCMSKILTYRL